MPDCNQLDLYFNVNSSVLIASMTLIRSGLNEEHKATALPGSLPLNNTLWLRTKMDHTARTYLMSKGYFMSVFLIRFNRTVILWTVQDSKQRKRGHRTLSIIVTFWPLRGWRYSMCQKAKCNFTDFF